MDIGPLSVVTALLAVGTGRLARLVARRRNPLLTGTLVAVVVATGLAATVEWRHQWVQAEATRVVRALSADPSSRATCQRFSGDLTDISQHAGFVSWDDAGTARLRRAVCRDLGDWILSGSGEPTEAQLVAVHVLTHEAMHVAGDRIESSTECSAVQHDARAAELLGASPQVAAAMARQYYLTVYPRMPDEYRSGSCVEDGALDLTPRDGSFP